MPTQSKKKKRQANEKKISEVYTKQTPQKPGDDRNTNFKVFESLW